MTVPVAQPAAPGRKVGPLINRNFTLLWGGGFISVLGDLAFTTTLIVWVETVKTHVGNILTKLHLAHRTQAALYAVKRGLISLDDVEP